MPQVATAPQKGRRYNPHETARMDSLAGVPLASFAARAIAYLIDFLLITITYVPVRLLAHWLMGDFKREPDIRVEVTFHDPWSLAWIVLYFAVSVYLGNGKTIGKKITGIRVVSIAHEKITLWTAVERALGYGASALELGFGFLQFFIHPNRCCVHDRIAETIVIRDRG